MNRKTYFILFYFLINYILSNISLKTNAQLIQDNTLGNENSIITPNQQIRGDIAEYIEGGTIRGEDLFHSFREFNINELQRVYFANPSGIENILIRVTGNNISNILGTLGVNGDANLFLMNPQGLYFGENARLDITGSFLATTAENVLFSDFNFSATNPTNPPLLTLNIPLGLQMGINPGRIEVQGNGNQLVFNTINDISLDLFGEGLSVLSGKQLGLIGGEIKITGGRVISRNGAIIIGALQGGEILYFDEQLNLDFNPIQNFEDITLSQEAAIENLQGNIALYGRNITLTQGSTIIADTFEQNGGIVSINATETLNMIGDPISELRVLINQRLILDNSGSRIYANAVGLGNGGDVLVNANKVILQDVGQITTVSRGEGDSGNITINAIESVEIDTPLDRFVDTPSGLLSVTLGRGNSGDITINTRNLTLNNGSVISSDSLGEGNAGNININAIESVEILGQSMSISSFVNIQNNNVFPTEIAVGANQIRETNFDLTFSGIGNGGELEINTGKLIIKDGARISAETISTDGGNIDLNISDYIFLEGAANITTSAGTAQTGGNGGNINILSPFIIAIPNQNNNIISNAFSGNGGDIDIVTNALFGINFTQDNILVRNDISASSQFGLNGTVEIVTPEVDPTSGLIELPQELIDIDTLIGKDSCRQSIENESKFIIRGRDGLPVIPSNTINSNHTWEDWRLEDINTSENHQSISNISSNEETTINNNSSTIQQAQGWMITNQGNIILTAQALTPHTQISEIPFLNCSNI